ncbi:hypothetical protein MK489_00920 [Myxococcota bacterium]|nr:hypothetical protein [Myxococcota bacterium]
MLLALDFDGVVSDSAAESFVVALRTYRNVRPGGVSAGAEESVLSGPCPPRDRVEADATYRAFLSAMPLGNRAEDYGVVLRALEDGAELSDQATYDRFRGELSDDWLREFHLKFYELRDELSRRDPAGWLGLMGPFEPFLAILRRRSQECRLAIATAKDANSVRSLLESYQASDLFAPEMILDKETGVNKRAHLSLLQERTGIDFADITFVDDKQNHLESVSDLGVRCALAAWGYNGPREIELARSRGFLVCSLEDAEGKLFP